MSQPKPQSQYSLYRPVPDSLSDLPTEFNAQMLAHAERFTQLVDVDVILTLERVLSLKIPRTFPRLLIRENVLEKLVRRGREVYGLDSKGTTTFNVAFMANMPSPKPQDRITDCISSSQPVDAQAQPSDEQSEVSKGSLFPGQPKAKDEGQAPL